MTKKHSLLLAFLFVETSCSITADQQKIISGVLGLLSCGLTAYLSKNNPEQQKLCAVQGIREIQNMLEGFVKSEQTYAGQTYLGEASVGQMGLTQSYAEQIHSMPTSVDNQSALKALGRRTKDGLVVYYLIARVKKLLYKKDN
jgi:alcohol dehydrogenase class IV